MVRLRHRLGSNYCTGISQNGVANIRRKLKQVLMRDREREPNAIFAQ
jgi:hypothetical protein